MTAPAEVPVEVTTPPKRVTHRLCAVEVRRAEKGLARETLCGKVRTGFRSRSEGTKQRCPMCEDLRHGHDAHCPDCQAAWPNGRPV